MPRYPMSPPDDWDKVSDYIEDIEKKMRIIENSEDKGLKEPQRYWEIFYLHNKRTKYIYNLFKHGNISKNLYNYLVHNFYCDHMLVRYWKKNGYENLCCLRCIQKNSKNSKVCICRVPRKKFNLDSYFECENCGCKGCCGY